MSAWDIAGAVVWTPLAIAFAWVGCSDAEPGDEAMHRRAARWSIPLALGAAFCIARLYGAHA